MPTRARKQAGDRAAAGMHDGDDRAASKGFEQRALRRGRRVGGWLHKRQYIPKGYLRPTKLSESLPNVKQPAYFLAKISGDTPPETTCLTPCSPAARIHVR